MCWVVLYFSRAGSDREIKARLTGGLKKPMSPVEQVPECPRAGNTTTLLTMQAPNRPSKLQPGSKTSPLIQTMSLSPLSAPVPLALEPPLNRFPHTSPRSSTRNTISAPTTPTNCLTTSSYIHVVANSYVSDWRPLHVLHSSA